MVAAQKTTLLDSIILLINIILYESNTYTYHWFYKKKYVRPFKSKTMFLLSISYMCKPTFWNTGFKYERFLTNEKCNRLIIYTLKTHKSWPFKFVYKNTIPQKSKLLKATEDPKDKVKYLLWPVRSGTNFSVKSVFFFLQLQNITRERRRGEVHRRVIKTKKRQIRKW